MSHHLNMRFSEIYENRKKSTTLSFVSPIYLQVSILTNVATLFSIVVVSVKQY